MSQSIAVISFGILDKCDLSKTQIKQCGVITTDGEYGPSEINIDIEFLPANRGAILGLINKVFDQIESSIDKK